MVSEGILPRVGEHFMHKKEYGGVEQMVALGSRGTDIMYCLKMSLHA